MIVSRRAKCAAAVLLSLACLALQTTAIAQTCNPGQTPTTPTSEFAVHGDGTVTHLRTGLMWKVCAEGQSFAAGTCTGTAATYYFDDALTHADGHSYAGHKDWRMPSIQELDSIVEYCRGHPIASTINDQVFPASAAFNLWSGSPVDQDFGWLIHFGDPYTASVFRGYANHVRLVRGAQPFRALGYLENGICGTVADLPARVAPSTAFCARTDVPSVTTTENAYRWRCPGARDSAGQYSGATLQCSAPRAFLVTTTNSTPAGGTIDCMATSGSARAGSAVVVRNQTATCLATPNPGFRTVSISGCGGTAVGASVNSYVTGAITADCTVAASFGFLPLASTNGICGGAVNAFSSAMPTANLCASVGGNSVVTQLAADWHWTCVGTNGGAHASCAAPATRCTMDIDGDNVVNSTSDALIHARIAVGMTGPEVLNGLNIPLNAVRRDWTSIRDHLVNRCGMSLL
jgi:Protein of unknown function (DUF1566)